MKTPEEIKKGLETCIGKCTGNKPHCPYHTCGDGCMDSMNRDALSYIQQLEKMLGESFARNAPALEAAYGLAEKVRQLEAKVPKWISAKEPPEKWKDDDGTLKNYLVYMPEYGVDVGNYMKPAKTWVCMGLPCKVTHWMPLPEPPEV